MASRAEVDLATLGAFVRRVGSAAMAESRAFALAHESATPEAMARLYETHLEELNAVQAMTFMIDLLAARYASLRSESPADAGTAPGDEHDFHRIHLRWTECVIAVSVATMDIMRNRNPSRAGIGITIPTERRIHCLNEARFAERQSRTEMERLIHHSQGI